MFIINNLFYQTKLFYNFKVKSKLENSVFSKFFNKRVATFILGVFKFGNCKDNYLQSILESTFAFKVKPLLYIYHNYIYLYFLKNFMTNQLNYR